MDKEQVYNEINAIIARDTQQADEISIAQYARDNELPMEAARGIIKNLHKRGIVVMRLVKYPRTQTVFKFIGEQKEKPPASKSKRHREAETF